MNKPFTLKVQEIEEEIIKIINNAEMPAFCLKVVLNDVMQKIENLDLEEIKKYNEFLEKENKEKEE